MGISRFLSDAPSLRQRRMRPIEPSGATRSPWLYASVSALALIAGGLTGARPAHAGYVGTGPGPSPPGPQTEVWANPSGGAFSGNNWSGAAYLSGSGPQPPMPPDYQLGEYTGVSWGSFIFQSPPRPQDTAVFPTLATGNNNPNANYLAPYVGGIYISGPTAQGYVYPELPAGTTNYIVQLGGQTITELDATSGGNAAAGAAPGFTLGGLFTASTRATFQVADGATPITIAGGGSLLTPDLEFAGVTNVSGGALIGATTTIDSQSSSSDPLGGSVTASTLKLTGSGASLTAATSLYIGETANTSATLDLESGAHVSSGNVYLGLGSAKTQGSIIVNASTMLTSKGFAAIGYNGSGGVTISNGGIWSLSGTSGDVFVSGLAGSKGSAIVMGSGSQLTAGGYIIVGQSGAGTLQVSNEGIVAGDQGVFVGNAAGSNASGTLDISSGGQVNAQISGGASAYAAILGGSSGATGSAILDGSGSAWTVSQSMRIGALGTGSVTVSGGAKLEVDGATLEVGSLKGGTGNLTIDGAGSSLVLPTGALIVGSAGTGTVTLQNNAALDQSNQTLVLGSLASGNGTIAVLSGSTFKVANLTLGGAGTGELDIGSTDGGGNVTTGTATITGTTLVIGRDQGSNGTLEINGASKLNFSGSFQDGVNGAGTIDLESGATLSTTSLTLGSGLTSTGTLTVDNSNFSTSGALTVASSGTGILNVQDGGTAMVGGDLVVGQGVGSGKVTVDSASGTGTSTLTVSGNLSITGAADEGASNNVTVQNGGQLKVTGNLSVGGAQDTAGYLNVTGNGMGGKISTVQYSGQLQVNPVGSLTISNAGVLTHTGGSSGTDTVTGQVLVQSASDWNDGSATIALSGSGSLSVKTGAHVEAGTLDDGSGQTGAPQVTIDGMGNAGIATKLTLTSGLHIDIGQMTVSGGAILNINEVYSPIQIGQHGTSTLTATGQNTLINALQTGVSIGDQSFGNGKLSVLAGATVGFGDVTMAGEQSSITVSGNNSTLTVLTLGGTFDSDQIGASVSVQSGATLSATSIDMSSLGPLTVDGGTLNVTGDLTIGAGSIGSSIMNGSTVKVGGNLNVGNSSDSSNNPSLIIDNSMVTAATMQIFYNTTVQNSSSLSVPDLTIYATLDVDSSSTLKGLNTVELLSGELNLNNAVGVSSSVSMSGGTIRISSGGSLAVGGGGAPIFLGGGNQVILTPDGLITGTGAIYANTLNGGVLHIGDDPGTMTIHGNYAQTSTGVLQIEVGPASYSQLVVTGAATLAGTLQLEPVEGAKIQLGQSYQVVTAAGGITGAFSTIETGNPFITLTGSVENGVLDLTTTHAPNSFAALARTSNQAAVAGALDAIAMGSPTGAASALANSLTDLAVNSPASAPAAFDSLSGEAYASANSAMIEESRFPRDAALNRLRQAFGEPGAVPLPAIFLSQGISQGMPPSASGYADAAPAKAAAARAPDVVAWGQAYDSWGATAGDGNAATQSRTTGGMVFGIDTPIFDAWRVGGLGGFSHSSFSVSARGSSGFSDNFDLGLYAGRQWGQLGLRLGAVYTYHDVSMDRSASAAGFFDSLTGHYGADTTQGFAELAYRIDIGPATLEPFEAAALVNFHSNAFSEAGGAAALSANSSNTTVAFSTLGLRATRDFSLPGLAGALRASAGWRYADGGLTPSVAFSLAGSNPFSVSGLPIARNAAVLEAGVDFAVARNVTLGGSYVGQFSAGITDQSAKANLVAQF